MKNRKYYIKNMEKIDPGVVVLDIADKRGEAVFDFKPGQYLMISYQNNNGSIPDKHAFSIASSPAATDKLTLGIKVFGPFTQGLSKLKAGDEVFVSGPFGNFFFDEKKHQDLVMIAGGIGITPFMSAIKYATDKNLSNKIKLLYSNRTMSSILFYDDLKKMEARNSNFKTLFSVTEEKLSYQTAGLIGERLNGRIIGNFIGDFKNKTFFLCGPVGFMTAVRKELLGLGVKEKQIQQEEFSMIPDAGFWLGLRNFSYATGFAAVAMALPFYLVSSLAQASVANPRIDFQTRLSSFYDSTKLYDLTKVAYDQIVSDKIKGIKNIKLNQVPVFAGKMANVVVAKKPAINVVTETAGVIDKTAVATPKPATSVSGIASNSTVIPNSTSVSAPAPTTSVSGVVSNQNTNPVSSGSIQNYAQSYGREREDGDD